MEACSVMSYSKEGTESHPWNQTDPIFLGDAFYDRLAILSEKAERSIDIDFYIFEDDPIGRRFFNNLAAASRRGVEVRIIIDGFGSVWWPWSYASQARDAGIQFRVYHQMWFERFLARSPHIQDRVRGFFSGLQAINHRNHRKIALFDRQTALVGSRNIAAVHSESINGGRAWRDSSIELQGRGVEILSGHFDYVWNSHRLVKRFSLRKTRYLPTGSANGSIRHNLTRSARKRNFKQLIADLGGAQKRIWITNAYFVPEQRIIDALTSAARQGCDVQILLPAFSDIFFIPWVAAALQRELLESGVRIFEYRPSVLHAKSMIVDDSVMIGSSNLNHRSFFHDLETDIVVANETNTDLFSRQFELDRENSRELKISEWYYQKRLWRIAGTLLLPLRRWM